MTEALKERVYKCPACMGTGKTTTSKCDVCRGCKEVPAQLLRSAQEEMMLWSIEPRVLVRKEKVYAF
jgi:hypothetical protein